MEFFRKIKIKKSKISSSEFRKLFKYISRNKEKDKIKKLIIRLSEGNNLVRNSISLHKLLKSELKLKAKIVRSITISGTGGDNKNTINLTTSTAIILSMLGIKTIKNNGNSYITNKGSYKFINIVFKKISKRTIKNILGKYKKTKLLLFCFKQVASRNFFGKAFSKLRKEIRKVTIFNYSLSSFNTFKSKYFMLCVNNPIETNRISEIVKKNGSMYSAILSSYDKVDEPTLYKKIKVIRNRKKKSMELVIDIKKLGFKTEKNNRYLYSKNIKESYKKFINAIENKKEGEKIIENVILFICIIFNLRFEKKINYAIDIIRSIFKTRFLKKKLKQYKKKLLWKG
ncbi:hypothetical protein [Candidatus Vidania fulgoroideorum]